MNLIIVESPTKARTLAKFLGNAYDVEATMGHIKDLPKSTLGVDIENDFAPEFVDVPKRADTIAKLIKLSKKAKTIYVASDPDREGEAIAQHVADILHADSKLKRVTFHEITKGAVTDAINNPHEIDKNLVDAQTARRVLDRLVGYKLSPLLWKKVRVGLSAGRVQSVVVRLVVEKEREIGKFKAEEYWEIYSKVKSRNSKVKDDFTVQLIKIGDKAAEVKNKDEADKILADLEKAEYKVADIKKRKVTKSPYPPFTTSTLSQAGSRVFGWSSKKTMSVAQKLYEEGFITYHRTDSLNLAKTAVDSVRSFIQKEYGDKYLPPSPRFFKTVSKVAQEAHEAIRPTDVNFKLGITGDKFAEENSKLYELIWARFVACQMNPSIFDETTIEVSAEYKVQSTKYLLRASGQIMIFDGWRRVLPIKKDAEEVVVTLPDVEKDEELDLIKTWGDQKFTQPPARYNEASLIKTLEKLGIGRPSTYAPTISTVQVRNYIEKNESKQFMPTSIGIAVNDFLIGNFPDTFEYQFTAHMENDLDDIANGKLKWVEPIKEFWSPFANKLKDVEKNSERVKIETEKLGRTCPNCDEARVAGDASRTGELVVRTGRFGKFISCSLFPTCKYTEKYLEKVGVICPECKKGEVIVKKTGKGRRFFGCSRYPDCKYASWRSPKKEEEK
ncbi:MAG: type I DNA topoisomerase [Candidatus Woesebacteria bacterium]|nr:MAG: type I DNA topoisomerase [Candidatus Woesebacteria bacterium]